MALQGTKKNQSHKKSAKFGKGRNTAREEKGHDRVVAKDRSADEYRRGKNNFQGLAYTGGGGGGGGGGGEKKLPDV